MTLLGSDIADDDLWSGPGERASTGCWQTSPVRQQLEVQRGNILATYRNRFVQSLQAWNQDHIFRSSCAHLNSVIESLKTEEHGAEKTTRASAIVFARTGNLGVASQELGTLAAATPSCVSTKDMEIWRRAALPLLNERYKNDLLSLAPPVADASSTVVEVTVMTALLGNEFAPLFHAAIMVHSVLKALKKISRDTSMELLEKLTQALQTFADKRLAFVQATVAVCPERMSQNLVMYVDGIFHGCCVAVVQTLVSGAGAVWNDVMKHMHDVTSEDVPAIVSEVKWDGDKPVLGAEAVSKIKKVLSGPGKKLKEQFTLWQQIKMAPTEVAAALKSICASDPDLGTVIANEVAGHDKILTSAEVQSAQTLIGTLAIVQSVCRPMKGEETREKLLKAAAKCCVDFGAVPTSVSPLPPPVFRLMAGDVLKYYGSQSSTTATSKSPAASSSSRSKTATAAAALPAK